LNKETGKEKTTTKWSLDPAPFPKKGFRYRHSFRNKIAKTGSYK
jgi:hypothetical protein